MSEPKYYDITVPLSHGDCEDVMYWSQEQDEKSEFNWNFPPNQDENIIIRVKIKLEDDDDE